MDIYEVYMGNAGIWTQVALVGSGTSDLTIFKSSSDSLNSIFTDTVTSIISVLRKVGADAFAPSLVEVSSIVKSGTAIVAGADRIVPSLGEVAVIFTAIPATSDALLPSVVEGFNLFKFTDGSVDGGPYGYGIYGRGLYGVGTQSVSQLARIEDTASGTGNLQCEFDAGWDVSTSEHYSSLTTAVGIFRFIGTSFTIYGAKASHHGNMKITVDGGTPIVVDCYASAREAQAILYRSGTLANTGHTITISPNGTKNASSTGTVVAVDYVDVASTNSTIGAVV